VRARRLGRRQQAAPDQRGPHQDVPRGADEPPRDGHRRCAFSCVHAAAAHARADADYLRVAGAKDIYAIGDCAASSYAPTAQVASQQGAYLARALAQVAKADALRDKIAGLRAEGKPLRDIDAVQQKLEKAERVRPFHYSHQGSLAYIGSDKAIADLSVWQRTFSSGGGWTYLFWRSAYLSTLFSMRNRTMVAMDWAKVKLFGRCVRALLSRAACEGMGLTCAQGRVARVSGRTRAGRALWIELRGIDDRRRSAFTAGLYRHSLLIDILSFLAEVAVESHW
jgi:hypothetical protein